MSDSEAKKLWMKQHTITAAVKLNRNQDADLIEYYGGRVTGGDIRQALREYMGNHPHKAEHRYGMRLRGFSPGAQPRGSIRREDDPTGKYHDIIVYDRQLSADEIVEYELDELN